MKTKIRITLLLSLLLLVVAGCGKSSNKPEFVDGRYRAEWSAPDDSGYTEYIIVDVKNGIPTVLEFDGRDSSGFVKSSDNDLRDQMLAANSEKGLPEMFHQRGTAKIIERFAENGNKTGGMEQVAGATLSYKSFKVLYNLLAEEHMKVGNFETLTVPYYADGVYKVSYPTYDLRGYREVLELTVRDGTPTVTAANAEDLNGGLKTANENLTAPADLTEVYRALIDGRNSGIEEVVVVAGATTTVAQFDELHYAALEAAHFRTTNEFILPKYKDGNYRAEMAHFDANGYKDFLEIEIKNGYVTVTDYGSMDESGSLKTDDTALADKYKTENPSAKSFAEYEESTVKNFYSVNGSVLEMENVAGATISANNFKMMLGQLLYYNAARGNHVVLVVENVDFEN